MNISQSTVLWLGLLACFLHVDTLVVAASPQQERLTRKTDVFEEQESSATATALSPVCACPTCTDEVLDTQVWTNGRTTKTCRDVIEDYKRKDYPEEHACRITSGVLYPEECGPHCDPMRCNNNQTETEEPQEPQEEAPLCGCHECTEELLSQQAGTDATCKDRIEYLLARGFTEVKACYRVAWEEFPQDCAPQCDPSRCDRPLVAPFDVERLEIPCGCEACTDDILDQVAGQYTCREHIDYLMSQPYADEIKACTKIGRESFPYICGYYCDPTRCETGESLPTVAPTALPTAAPTTPPCGCQECTDEILDRFAGGDTFTCRDRIRSSYSFYGGTKPHLDEEQACFRVASQQWPSFCGPECDPSRCDGRHVPCGCHDCTDDILDRVAGNHTCRSRIDWLQQRWGGDLQEHEACLLVSETEFPEICGPACDPSRCSRPAHPCGCTQCSTDVLYSFCDNVRCGDRVEWLKSPENGGLTETEACALVASEYPIFSDCDPMQCNKPRESPLCGCPSCTGEVLDRMAGAHTCRNRIRYLQSAPGGNHDETTACSMIASLEYPSICGPECDPSICNGDDGPPQAPTEAPSTSSPRTPYLRPNPSTMPSEMPSDAPSDIPSDAPSEMPSDALSDDSGTLSPRPV